MAENKEKSQDKRSQEETQQTQSTDEVRVDPRSGEGEDNEVGVDTHLSDEERERRERWNEGEREYFGPNTVPVEEMNQSQDS